MSKHWLIFQSAVFAATFNKASQQTPFVSDNIIQLTDDDACSVCSGVFSKSSQISSWGLNMVSGDRAALF